MKIQAKTEGDVYRCITMVLRLRQATRVTQADEHGQRMNET